MIRGELQAWGAPMCTQARHGSLPAHSQGVFGEQDATARPCQHCVSPGTAAGCWQLPKGETRSVQAAPQLRGAGRRCGTPRNVPNTLRSVQVTGGLNLRFLVRDHPDGV